MGEVDYGYGDGTPDYVDARPDSAANTDYGYGDSSPDANQQPDKTDYGYGDGQPDYGYGDAQPDYGYNTTASKEGDKTDYGYGDAQPEYGYGDAQPEYGNAQPDYGYGDAQPDYGYGDAQPDYGYGDAQPDYGYGDAQPDYGYGDAQPDEAPPAHACAEPMAADASKKEKRPKRRCSVTRFSIEAEACDRPLDYSWQGLQQEQEQQAPPTPTPPEAYPERPQYDKSSAISETMTESTAGNSSDGTDEDGGMLAKVKLSTVNMPKKKGMLGKIRKRLSII